MRRTSVALALALALWGCERQGTTLSSELALRTLAAAVERADTALVADLFWPDATYDDFANQTTYEGLEEIVGYVTAAHEWGDDIYMNIGRVHGSENGAVGEWVFTAVQSRPLGDLVPMGTGLEVVLNGVTIIELEQGRIVRAADYSDTAPFVLQLGGHFEYPGGAVIRLDDLGN